MNVLATAVGQSSFYPLLSSRSCSVEWRWMLWLMMVDSMGGKLIGINRDYVIKDRISAIVYSVQIASLPELYFSIMVLKSCS